ncbi:potassium channel family protein [Rhodoferax sp. WC2427]|uniref:potassium channel family protein n=1 Tax=Rhodoferax sp. WC2427 TaxID=3234144 RepID=UPI0034664CA8
MWDSTAASSATSAIELDEFSKSVDEIDREASAAQNQLRALEREQKTIELAAKAVYEEHSAKLWSNVEQYKQKAVAVESAAVERATTVADALASAAQKSPSPAAAIAAANAKVDVAKAQYVLAVRQADTGDYVLHHLRELADPNTTAKFDATETKLATLRKEQISLMGRLADLRGKAFNRLEDWYSKRTARLQWIDFLYFSVGVSTTTTFGDIVPNSRMVRVFVLTQLIFSVLLVGYLVSLLGSPRSAP